MTSMGAGGCVVTTIVGSRGQQADIGGTTPGLMLPDSTSIDEEGVPRDAGRRRVWGAARMRCRMTVRFDGRARNEASGSFIRRADMPGSPECFAA
ncbi:hypothetical protein WJ50_05805 [Burkholderia ubonensis]|nr:hypothetical protein WJ50_05805 [Burkholderia ubonensis]